MSNPTPEKTELLNLLKSFISFKSTEDSPNQKTECLDWIQAAFLGLHDGAIQRGDFEGSPWLYAPAKNTSLLIFAHTDVVPAPDSLFELQTDGDRALGRGVSDMKGNILPFLMAYRDACKEGNQPPVSILITTDEEVAGHTIPYLLEEGIVTAPAAFTPDSNHLGIVCEHKGGVWATLTAKGKGGHGAYPWDAENPIYHLSEALASIKKAFPTGGHDDWQMTVTPTMLHGSTAGNQIPATATCNLDIRFVPEDCPSEREAIARVEAVLPDTCFLTVVRSCAPLFTDHNHPAVCLYTNIASQVLGQEIPLKREHGGTDARYFAQAGIPAFLYGPEGGGLHSDSEWVSISSLQNHYKIYRELFAALQ